MLNLIVDAGQDGVPCPGGRARVQLIIWPIQRNDAESWRRPEQAALPKDCARVHAQLIQLHLTAYSALLDWHIA